jgi:hypothetical protein
MNEFLIAILFALQCCLFGALVNESLKKRDRSNG